MRKSRLGDLQITSETLIEAYPSDPRAKVEIVVRGVATLGWLKSVRIFSRPGGKGEMFLDFECAGIGTVYYNGSYQLKKELRLYMQELQRFVGRKTLDRPVGVTSYKWQLMQPGNVLGNLMISDFYFRLGVNFEVNHEERERFVEAALRILGGYLDAFKIPRNAARPNHFFHETYVMVKRPGAEKRERTKVVDYLLERNGF